MLHSIEPEKFGPLGEPMARAVQSCVHCGFCLAACPTYAELGQEMDTPRGRIVLMKQVLEGTLPWERARAFRKRVIDVSVFLSRLGLREKFAERKIKVAYHDACHLANAQNIRREPRALLRAIPGLELIEVANAHLCCGSAGTYNLDEPEIAASLGEQKAKAVIATGAEVVASGNIGCLTQLRMHLAKLGSPIQVRHTMQVLRDANAGNS